MTAYCFAPAGSDSGKGTLASPWRTVAKANSLTLQPGDQVFFAAGAYSDDTLMPSSFGVPGLPISYMAWGAGRPSFTKGCFFAGPRFLRFYGLAFGIEQGFEGGNQGAPSNFVEVRNCLVGFGSQASAGAGLGLNACGSGWRIVNNTVRNCGDSGMLLRGDTFQVADNDIYDCGLNTGLGYGTHGIYLKAPHSSVVCNDIWSCKGGSGVSTRYRDCDISGNTIRDVPIGVSFFEYDLAAGVTRIVNNAIDQTVDAGIYVSPSDKAGATIERFYVDWNAINPASGVKMNLDIPAGLQTVGANNT